MHASARETYAMLGRQSLWDVAERCHVALAKAGIPHAIVGGVAVCLHGYRRNTVDLDVLVRREDSAAIQAALAEAGLSWAATALEFRTADGIPVQVLTAGEKAGKVSEVTLPNPAGEDHVVMIEGLPVISLAGLIEAKIACGEGDPRRIHRDFADVVELVASHGLDGSFARHLHESVRPGFRRLVKLVR